MLSFPKSIAARGIACGAIMLAVTAALLTIATDSFAQEKIGPNGKTAAQCRAQGHTSCKAIGTCMGYTDAQNKQFCR